MFKKLYLSLTLLTAFLWLGTGTMWGAQSLPYSYGFEDYSLETDGWTKYFGTSLSSNNAECAIVGAAKKTGSYGFRFSSYQTQGANAQYLISPEFSAPNGLDVTFQYKASSTNTSGETFKVGYSTTDADVSSFTWGAEISYKSTSWKAYENSFPAGTKYIAIYYYANYQYRLYVDDFTFAATPSCTKPTSLSISSIRSTTATFTWTKGKDETSWQYICLPAADALDWSGAATANSETATVNGLSAETDYKFYVRADCGSEQSAEAVKAFTTPCADYATTNLPLEENFNDKTAYPDCWSKVEFVSGTTSYPTIYSSNGESGSKSIRFYGGVTGTSEQIAILPPFEEATGNLLLSFWYKNGNASSSYGQFIIGYITDPTDASTFHQIGNALTRNSSGAEVNKFAMTGAPENSFIAIKYAGGSSSQSAYLDNIKVSLPSSCTDPLDVNAVAASATSATVSWTENGSATTWNLQYSTDNFTTSTTVSGITENPYTLDGLTANTTYKVRVQADCGGEQSDWIASAAFLTPCEDQTGVGYSMNFNSETSGSGKVPGCWQKNTYNDSYPQIYNYYAHGGSGKCLYFYGGVTGSSEQIAILPPFSEKTNKLSIALYYNNAYDYGDYSGAGYGQLSIGYMTNPADATSFVAKETLARVNSYTAAEVALVGAPDNAYIAIRYAGGSSTGQTFVDDIVISEVSSCLKPSSVSGSATAYDRASISWTENGSATAWQLRYSSDNGENWSAAIDVNENPYLLTGLSGNNNYLVQVQSVCGVSEYSGWSMASAAIPTPCQPVDASDYSENMESSAINVGNLPDCWQYREKFGAGIPYVYNGSSYAYAGNNSLYFQGGVDESSEQSVLLPEMDQPLNNLTLEFYYKDAESGWYTYAKFTVGYIAADGTTFVPVETLDYANSYTKYTKDLAALPADAKCLAIRFAGGESTAYGYIDNVRVYPTPSCASPTGVTVSNVTATTADVAWTAGGEETAWKLQISNDGTNWTDVNGVITNPYQLTGLAANHTTYYVHVKAVCGENDESPYSDPSAPFETECAVASLPFNEDFSGSIDCWTMTNCVANTGINSDRFRFYYGYSSQYLISPEIDSDEKPVTVEFDYSVYSSAETFMVGYSTTTNATSAFTWGVEQTASNTSVLRYSENLPAGVKYVAIQYTSYDKYYFYIDNFSVTEYVAPACPAVSAATLQESAVTAHTATVSWTAGNEETAWNLQYKAAGAADWSSVIPVATTPSYDFEGLAENTLYYVKVQADCGGDQSTWTGDEAFSFRTDCEPKAVSKASPWNYSFEDTEDGFMPSCWDREEPYANYDYPVVAEYSYYANTGTNYLYLRTPGRSGGSAYTEDAILPVFNTEIKNLKVSFVYFNGATTSNYGQLAIGYVAGNEFTQVGDALEKVDDYTSVEREMPNDAPDGARIAIRCIGSIKGSAYTTTVYLDDIVVSLKPTCYTPTALAAEATSDGANVSWTAGKDESEWNIRYSIKDADSWTVIEEIAVANYTLNGLTAGTTYEVQVRAYCGAGDESEWSASVDFAPACNAPSALAVTGCTSNSATFSWTSTESAWVLQYSVDGENWLSANVNANPFTLESLAPATAYQAKIQAACGSEFSNVVEFTTWCGLAEADELPLNEDFSAGVKPACWEFISDTEYPVVTNEKIWFQGENEQIVMLPGYNINLNQLHVSFDFTASNASIELGYYAANGGAFQSLGVVTSGADIDLSTTSAPAAKGYLAIRYYDATASWSTGSVDNVHVSRQIVLADNADNTETIAAYMNKTVDVTIGRTIVRKGYYNTICLPFSLSAEELAASPIASNDLWAFKYAKVDEATDELLFRIIESDHIEAGVPYFIGFENNENDIVNPLFKNVTISATAGQEVGNDVAKLCGIVDQPVVFNAGDQTKLFLAANNTLYWWNGSANSQLNNFRAYFKVATSGSNAPARHGMRARIIKQEETATGIENIKFDAQTLKLIENGNVVIIRNGIKYNVQGQVISK